MAKFKVGDRVRFIVQSKGNWGDIDTEIVLGKIYTIDIVGVYNWGYGNTESPVINEIYGGYICPDNIELVQEKIEIADYTDGVSVSVGECVKSLSDFSIMGAGCEVELKNNKKTIMSKITEFAKNLVLSADEKLLRKHNLKDSCGNYTSDAQQLVIDKMIKDNEAYLIEIAKGLEEETNNK